LEKPKAPATQSLAKNPPKDASPRRRSRQPKAHDELGDVAFAFGKDEHGVHVLRRRSADAPIEAGVIRPLVQGQPITDEVVSLRARADAPGLFDVKVELESSHPRTIPPRPGDGPSQVATDSYRKGWDSIWGRKGAGSRSLN
jgi:hypothetical protein